MNKTKRKIFETSMKLFAKKGYEATSIEEITATVGVAKGTLYYHFSSKEEIFDFLIAEGIKLLQNSIDIKTSKYDNYIDKLKAILLIQIKIVSKYEEIITILINQSLGNEKRNEKCKEYICDYINNIEKILKKGIELEQIKDINTRIVAAEIYSLIYSTICYKNSNIEDFNVMNIFYQYENTIIRGLKA